MSPLSGIEPVAVEVRVRELRRAIACLLPDLDDPTVLSEAVVLMGALRRLEASQ